MKLKTQLVNIFHQYSNDWPPSNLYEFILWLEKQIETIPEKYRETAEIELSKIELNYQRPETEQEIEYRKKKRT